MGKKNITFFLVLLGIFILLSAFGISHINIKLKEYDDKIFEIKDFTMNGVSDDFYMRNLSKNDPKVFNLKAYIPREEFEKLNADLYKLILWKISAESYKIYFNGKLIDHYGDIENNNSYIWTGIKQVNIHSDMIEDQNELILELHSSYMVGKTNFPLIITTPHIGDKIFVMIDTFLVSGYRVMLGLLMMISIFGIVFIYMSGMAERHNYYLTIAGILASIYMLNFTVIERLPFSILTFKKIVVLCLYFSVYFIGLFFNYTYKKSKLLWLARLTVVAILFNIFICNDIITFRRFYNITNILIVINMGFWFYSILKQPYKNFLKTIIPIISVIISATTIFDIVSSIIYPNTYLGISRYTISFIYLFIVSTAILLYIEEKNILHKKTVESEQALLKSKEKYQNLIEFLPDAIFIINEDKILFSNEAASKMIGIKRNHSLEEYKVLDFIPSDYQARAKEDIRKVLWGKGDLPLVEGKINKITGEEVDIEYSIKHVNYGGIPAVLCVVRDISQRKETEKLNSLLKETIEYDRLRTEFFANISHELRTPLNIILGTVQLLGMKIKIFSKKNEDVNLTRYVQVMRQNCYRLLRLINNLIDITKIDSGYFKIQKGNHNIVSITEEICLSVREFVENKGINITFDTDIEEKLIACDPDKIERIILNLLSNAIKFTDRGGEIYVTVSELQDKVLIAIKDTGIGIPSDKLDMVFERFRQVDKSLNRNYEGSGIGLSLVKQLVELHNGRISVKSEEGNGSEFIITLPNNINDESNVNNSYESFQQDRIEKINIEFSDIYSAM